MTVNYIGILNNDNKVILEKSILPSGASIHYRKTYSEQYNTYIMKNDRDRKAFYAYEKTIIKYKVDICQYKIEMEKLEIERIKNEK